MPGRYCLTGIALLAGLFLTADCLAVSGTATTFSSANGIDERCVRIAPIPEGHYSKSDREREEHYCSIDFSVSALCPKLWSTSPGTVVLSIGAQPSANDLTAWEVQNCHRGHHARAAAQDKLASFKLSVNGRETSATYSPSSLAYYHLSRFFDTRVHVPVAVYRSMDKQLHQQRVVLPAQQILAERHGMKMLKAGWTFLATAESDTTGGHHELLTDDGRQVYGVLLDNRGDRYGAEFNGTRESGWGVGQNEDFQQTAAFLALRSELPIAEAIEYGVHQARSNPRMAKALAAEVPRAQVALWMQEVLEIVVLDYLLGQQDRIGNIDYEWRWFWVGEKGLHSKRAHGTTVPDDLQVHQPLRLKRSAINDNDAGVRRGYANFAEKSAMLTGLRHFHPGLYRRLGLLAADLDRQGPIHAWMLDSLGLSAKEVQSISARAGAAWHLVQSDCASGNLKLDLEPALFIPGTATGQAKTAVNCELD